MRLRLPASSARSTVRSSLVSDSGFSTKSNAPRRVASTAVSTVPCPLIITTGQSKPCVSGPFAQQRDAVRVRHPDVEQHEVGKARGARGARLGRVGRRPRRRNLPRSGSPAAARGYRPRHRPPRFSHAVIRALSFVRPYAARAHRSAVRSRSTAGISHARAAHLAIIRFYAPAVFLHDLLDDGEPKPGALRLARDVGVEHACRSDRAETRGRCR